MYFPTDEGPYVEPYPLAHEATPGSKQEGAVGGLGEMDNPDPWEDLKIRSPMQTHYNAHIILI